MFPPVQDSLRDLHEQYIDAVNRAVADGRDDLVASLIGRLEPLVA